MMTCFSTVMCTTREVRTGEHSAKSKVSHANEALLGFMGFNGVVHGLMGYCGVLRGLMGYYGVLRYGVLWGVTGIVGFNGLLWGFMLQCKGSDGPCDV